MLARLQNQADAERMPLRALHAPGRRRIHRQDYRAEPAATASGLRAFGLKPTHGQVSQPPLPRTYAELDLTDARVTSAPARSAC